MELFTAYKHKAGLTIPLSFPEEPNEVDDGKTKIFFLLLMLLHPSVIKASNSDSYSLLCQSLIKYAAENVHWKDTSYEHVAQLKSNALSQCLSQISDQ